MISGIVDLVLAVLALGLVVLPGFLFAAMLFAKERQLWHLALSIPFSLAIFGYVLLIMSYVPPGITPQTLIVVLVVLNMLLFAGAVLRRRFIPERLEPGRRFVIGLGALLLIGGVAAIGGVGLSRLPGDRYTEFLILEGAAPNPPWQTPVPPDEPIGLHVEVTNYEGRETHYAVALMSDGTLVHRMDLGTIPDGARVQLAVDLPARTQPQQRYDILLYRDQQAAPYRQLYVWLQSPASTLVE